MGLAEQGTLERALERQFPWASDTKIREVANLVAENLSSRDFSGGFTPELRRDAEDLGEYIAYLVGPAPAVRGRVRRSLSRLPALRRSAREEAKSVLPLLMRSIRAAVRRVPQVDSHDKKPR